MLNATMVTIRKVGKKTKDAVKIHNPEIRTAVAGWSIGVGVGTGITLVAIGAVKLAQMAILKED